MTINGLDISLYQEQPTYGKLINWPALKADPLNFRFIWIKCAEGTDGTGYVEGAARQVSGARSVKFEAINPYHFYYFQWFSTTANRWYTLSAADQARAFYNAALASGFPVGPPMTDIEDPLTGQFLVWSDTASANAALAFARKLNAHLKTYHEEVARLFGVRPDIYTGAWWWNRMAYLLLENYPEECAWWEDYRFVLADYVGGLDLPMGIRSEQVLAWQFTSTPNPPVQGIPTGHVMPGDALDCDRWMRSEAEFLAWTGQTGGSTMAGIYKFDVPMAERAWVMEIKTDQKVNVPYTSLGVDAIILPMVGMPWDGNQQTIIAEPTFAGRFAEVNAASIPVFGKIVIDAGFVTTQQHSQPELDGHNIWNNLVVPRILDAWHVGPWTPETLRPADFRPVKMLIFEQTSEFDKQNRPVNDFWQAHFHQYVVDKLRVLMAAGAVPSVPIALKTTSAWLQKYPVDFATMLNQPERKKWLYFALSDPKLDSTAIMPDLWSIFKFAPGDEFKYAYVPDGYADRVLLYEFTAGKQRMTFATGTAYLSKWCDTAAELVKFLGTPVVQPGNPCAEQEAYIDELLNQIGDLQSQMVQMNDTIASQGEMLAAKDKKLAEWETWLAEAPR